MAFGTLATPVSALPGEAFLELSDVGKLRLQGRPITGPGPGRGVVFQGYALLPWLTVLGNVQLAVDAVFRCESKQARIDRVRHYVELVGLGAAHWKDPRELSGGMRQRVSAARGLAMDTKLLLLDEPFGRLDSLTRLELQEVLLDIWSEDQMTALMVTHDVDEALFLPDRVVMMTSGPRVRVGRILEVPFGRQRGRSEVLEHPDYYSLRGELIAFLESQQRETRAA